MRGRMSAQGREAFPENSRDSLRFLPFCSFVVTSGIVPIGQVCLLPMDSLGREMNGVRGVYHTVLSPHVASYC